MLNRLISTTDLEDPTIKVQSFRDRIFNNTELKSGSKIDSLLQAGDFSSFLKRAAFINPSGLQSGIENAQQIINQSELENEDVKKQLKEEAAEIAKIANAKGAEGLQLALKGERAPNFIDDIMGAFGFGQNIIKDLGGDPNVLAAKLAEEDEMITPLKMRDQLYLELLGKRRKNKKNNAKRRSYKCSQ